MSCSTKASQTRSTMDFLKTVHDWLGRLHKSREGTVFPRASQRHDDDRSQATCERSPPRWAEASIKGQARKAKEACCQLLGHRLQPAHSWPKQHRQPDQPHGTHLGNIGRPGCGPFSMTGQPNAMGERLTGGLTGRLPFNQGINNVRVARSYCRLLAYPARTPCLREQARAKHGLRHRHDGACHEGRCQGVLLDLRDTHRSTGSQHKLVRPALSKNLQCCAGNLPPCPKQPVCRCHFARSNLGRMGRRHVHSI